MLAETPLWYDNWRTNARRRLELMISWLGRSLIFKPAAALISFLWRPLPRKKNVVLRLRLAGKLAESVPRMPPLMPVMTPAPLLLGEVTALLRAVEQEPQISGLRLDIGRLQLGLARVQELRRAILAVRAAGKVVHVQLEGGGLREYLLACAADTITMPPLASLELTGMRSDVTYLGGVAAAAGVHADFEAVGDYKAFAERFVRSGATRAARRNSEEILFDAWEQAVSGVAAARGLDEEQAAHLLGSGPYGVEEAIEVGLVDGAAYPDEVRPWLKEQVGKHKTVKGIRYHSRLRRVRVWRQRAYPSPVIAVIPATGQVVPGKGGSGPSAVIASGPLCRQLNEARKAPDVEAVVLRIDSPGGSAEASDLIWREVCRLEEKKPVVASMGDVAASGGYYIAMGATRILAQPGTLTGSIGVVAGKINFGGLLDRLGVHQETLSVGANSGFTSVTRDFNGEERERLRGRMEEFYRAFVDKAAMGREVDAEELEQHARGRVWTGRQAVERQLVDELGGLREAVELASSLAGHERPLPGAMVLPPYRPMWWPGMLGGQARSWFSGWLTERFPQLAFVLSPELRQGGLLARLPFELRFF